MSEKQLVAIDIETFDPNLNELGAGSIRKDGYILEAGIYDGKEYYACRPEQPSWQRLIDVMKDKNITKVAHNGVYDYDWIQNGYDIQINGTMEDTMTREGLINEYAGQYGLDACCLREGVVGKNYEDTLEKWGETYGIKSVMSNLILVPPDIRESYNKQDCIATYELFHKQQPKLAQVQRDGFNLLDINDIECKQFPLILLMKKNGLRINIQELEKLTVEQRHKYNESLSKLYTEYGITSLTKKKGPGSILHALEQLGIADQLNDTKTGKSIAADSIKKLNHPIGKTLREMARQNTLLTKYLEGSLIKYRIGGRLHGTLKPTKRDEGGTVTGRYSASEPNLQNFAARENKGGDIIRGLFIPEDNCLMGSFDYKQIEYKVFAHYAVGPGSTLLRENMQHDVDYHQLVQDMLGWNFPEARVLVKTLNFGVAYGRGLNSIIDGFSELVAEQAVGMGMSPASYLTHFHSEYYKKLSFIRPTRLAIEAIAISENGLRSVGGRWHHLPPDGKNYKMVAYACQGGAADIIKTAMAKSWDAGVWNVLIPHVPVHDEIVFSIPKSKEAVEACNELINCMENCIQMRVPIKVDPGVGTNWWKAKEGEIPLTEIYKE